MTKGQGLKSNSQAACSSYILEMGEKLHQNQTVATRNALRVGNGNNGLSMSMKQKEKQNAVALSAPRGGNGHTELSMSMHAATPKIGKENIGVSMAGGQGLQPNTQSAASAQMLEMGKKVQQKQTVIPNTEGVGNGNTRPSLSMQQKQNAAMITVSRIPNTKVSINEGKRHGSLQSNTQGAGSTHGLLKRKSLQQSHNTRTLTPRDPNIIQVLRRDHVPTSNNPECEVQVTTNQSEPRAATDQSEPRAATDQSEPRASPILSEQQIDGGYNTRNRGRLRGMNPRNKKGRGCNIIRAPKQRVFVDVNENLQPVGDTARKLSSFIGCLARDPRKLALDCWDWRKMDQKKKDSFWSEVKESYYFPEGREPCEWGNLKMNVAWRGYKSELKVEFFDGKTHDDVIKSKPGHIPDDTWSNMVDFWESEVGQERSKRGIENRNHSTMCHYVGTKSFSRIRAEKKEKDGKEPDCLKVWLETHEPKKGSKLDETSAATKEAIMNELAELSEDACDTMKRNEIFKKVVGEDKHGYAKTFGLGVKVPRSGAKRCALQEERAKRIRSEEQVEDLQKQIKEAFDEIENLKDMMKKLIEQQGYTENPSNEERTYFEENEEQGDHELDHDFEDDLNWHSI